MVSRRKKNNLVQCLMFPLEPSQRGKKLFASSSFSEMYHWQILDFVLFLSLNGAFGGVGLVDVSLSVASQPISSVPGGAEVRAAGDKRTERRDTGG